MNRQAFVAGQGADSGQTQGGGPEKLRIGVHALRASEVVLVRSFVEMSAIFTADFPWVFADEPPFDAIVVDSENQPPLNVNIRDGAGVVLRITDHGAHSSDMMQRPLRYRIVEDWLKKKAVEIRATLRHRPELPASPPAADLSGGDPYLGKLDRWPPSAFLQRDRLRLRIATILATNGMNLSDLTAVCREPEEHIRDCVRSFVAAGLLELQPTRQRPGAQPEAGDRAVGVAAPPLKRKPGLGLIAAIRRRLGI